MTTMSETRRQGNESTVPDPHTKPATDADAAPTARKPKYEFKILPVNPKNSFDFEDVADK